MRSLGCTKQMRGADTESDDTVGWMEFLHEQWQWDLLGKFHTNKSIRNPSSPVFLYRMGKT